jgi:serine/threonine protein kinase
MLEIENMQRLSHPNIIRLYEVYEGEQSYYLILEYLEGMTLNDLIRQRGGQGFSMEEIKLIMRVLL